MVKETFKVTREKLKEALVKYKSVSLFTVENLNLFKKEVIMFCPKCKSEYEEGIQVCPECDEKLVNKLTEDDFVKFVKVFESGDPNLTVIIKSVLEDAGIKYFVPGDNMQSILGTKFSFAFGADIGNAQFLVSKEDEITARELLKEIENSEIVE
jgi:Putative prokaryotic signal transducing protein